MFLSVLIPTKDQSEKTLKNLKGPLWRYFEGCGVDYEVLICMDGSDEVNRRAMEGGMRMLPDHFHLLPYESKKGKGHNVRRLIEEARGDYVLFMDADLATDLESFTKFRPYIDEYPVIIASRYKEGAELPVPQGFLRRLMGKGSRLLIRALLGIKGIEDMQCGYKLIRRDIALLLASRQRIDGFAFDSEYLYMLQKNDIPVLEVPVRWTDDPDSTVKGAFRSSWNFLKELLEIRKHKDSYLLTDEEKEGLGC